MNDGDLITEELESRGTHHRDQIIVNRPVNEFIAVAR
jgi:hypothetical protein